MKTVSNPEKKSFLQKQAVVNNMKLFAIVYWSYSWHYSSELRDFTLINRDHRWLLILCGMVIFRCKMKNWRGMEISILLAYLRDVWSSISEIFINYMETTMSNPKIFYKRFISVNASQLTVEKIVSDILHCIILVFLQCYTTLYKIALQYITQINCVDYCNALQK